MHIGWPEYEAALAFAVAAHAGQRDKAGQPFINHPMRVAAGFRTPLLATIAILHDVVEDTPHTIEELSERWGSEVADAVDAHSRRDGETYPDYLERCMRNPLAHEVKRADVHDNFSRLKELDDEAVRLALFEKYSAALDRLGSG